MALFKIFKGNDINRLNNPNDPNYRIPIDGYAYYNTDNQEFYIDTYYKPTNSQIENNDSRIITNENDPNYGLLLDRRPINAHYAYSAGYDGASSPQKIHKTYIKNLEIKNNQLSYITGDGTSHSVEGTLGAVTGIKGNAETEYRTGQVNLTPANIGAATSGHTHTTTIATDNGTNQLTLAFDTKYKLTAGGTSYIFTMPANPDTNTASAADNILHGSNNGTEITYAPYTSRQSGLSFDTTTTNPNGTNRLNLNGYLYATKLYSGGKEVLTAHQSYVLPTATTSIKGGVIIGSNINVDTDGKISIDNTSITTALGYTPYNSSNPNGYTNNVGTITGIKMNGASKGTSGVVDLGTVITDVSGKLDKSGGTMTGDLTLKGDPTSNLHAATKQYVDNILTINDALVFKGVLGTDTGMISSLPPNAIDSSYKQGWTYKVGTAGTYAGQDCEIGDTIYCIADGTTANNANWTIIQTNIDGTVIGPSESAGGVAVFTGTTGKAIKDSGFTIATSVPENAVFTDTNTKVTSAANHYTPSTDANSELTASLSGTAGSYALNTEYTVLTGVKAQRDAKGHITGLTYTAQKIKDTNTTYTFDGTYNASTNKAATVSTVTNAINNLDVSDITGFGAGKTLSALSEIDGKISASFQNISITKSQISDFPTSMPASDVAAWAKASTKPSYAWNEITQSGANSIEEGTADFTDNTEIFSSYASNNGFADTKGLGKVYRRDTIHMYNYIKNKLAITNNNITLSRNTETTIATIGGTAIKIKLPASDNTDTKVQQSVSNTEKWRKILLHNTQDNTSTTAVTDATDKVYAAVGVSVQPSTGAIRAGQYNIMDKVSLIFNSTTNALDFVFA